MVSRRNLLIGAASISAAGLAGCYQSDSNTGGPSGDGAEPRATDWVPASQSLPVLIRGTKASNIVDVEGSGIGSEETVFEVPPSDIDLLTTVQTGSPIQYTTIDGSFEVEDVRDPVTSTLRGSFSEEESYNGYTRLSSSGATVGISSGRLAFVQPPDAATLEAILDTREGEGESLSAGNDTVGQLSDTIGEGDITDIRAFPRSTTADNETEGDTRDRIGEAYAIDVQSEMSPFVFCYLYRNAEVTDADELRDRIDSGFSDTENSPEYDVTTDDTMVTATGELPTSTLPTN